MKKLDGRNVFVTGGAGFVGSSLVPALLHEGAKVTVYDNLSSGNYNFIKGFEGRKDFTFVKGDLLDRHKLARSLKADTDIVVHLAANPDVAAGTRNTRLDLEQGTIATYNVLDEARLKGAKDIIFSSSSVVYGIARTKPTPEDYGPLLPISLYGASKLACEGIVTSFSHLFGMDYYIYRFANVVGDNLTHGVVLDFARKLKKNPASLEVLGNGKQRKSYIDVNDCVNAMLHIYKRSGSRENVFNLATDDQCTPDEIARMVISRFSKGAKIRHTGGAQGWPGDVPDAWLSNRKMKAAGVKLKFEKSRDVVSNAVNHLGI